MAVTRNLLVESCHMCHFLDPELHVGGTHSMYTTHEMLQGTARPRVSEKH